MKKVITLGLASALSTMLLVGCGSAVPDAPKGEAHSGEIYKKHMTIEKVHKIVIKAGKEAGWKMTEFKSNAVIAEKIGSNESVTVTFDNSSFDISPSNSSLESAISDALE